MDLLLPDSWLREYLKTKAKAHDIARYLSLSGPSVEKLEEIDGEPVYQIEVTTNRVDMMSVYGIAREAFAILKRNGVQARLAPIAQSKIPKTKKEIVKIKNNPELVRRIMAVSIEDIGNWKTPQWMRARLELSGLRSLNLIVDITNYVMLETGHPCHVFDLDKVPEIVVRESKKGEKVIGLDGKSYELPGHDIVFDNGKGEIIDLPGILGLANSVVGKNTKRVLFLIDNNEPNRIRRTSMKLRIRSFAAIINEKGVDSALGEIAIRRGIMLFEQVAKAKKISKIIDIYPVKSRARKLSLDKKFIDELLGIDIGKADISNYLNSLNIETAWKGESLSVNVPSFRAEDIKIEEDVVEEIARIYGYHNLPPQLMGGKLPLQMNNNIFDFEIKLKREIRALSGIEVYNSSLVSQEEAGAGAVKLKNPLGKDGAYLRTSLQKSLIDNLATNKREKGIVHLFEVGSVYVSKKNDLPEEIVKVGGAFMNSEYRSAKGVVEALLRNLNIKDKINDIGKFETVGEHYYYEFDFNRLYERQSHVPEYQEISKYPDHIEDITFTVPVGVPIMNVIELIEKVKFVRQVKLGSVYNRNYTFSLSYHDKERNLSNDDVKKIRERLVTLASQQFGIEVV